MKIAHIPRRFAMSRWGGTETVILEIAKEQIEQGNYAQIICPNALSPISEEAIRGVPVTRVPYFYPYFGLSKVNRRQLDYKGGNMFSFALIKKLLNEPELDIIHLHTIKRIGGIGRYAALKRRIPYVVTLHGGLFDIPADEAASLTDPIKKTFEWGKLLGLWVGSRRVLKDADAILCIGQNEFNEVQKSYPGKKVYLLQNGVNSKKFANGDGKAFRERYGIPGKAPLILTIGRIDPQKNQIFALEILEELIKIISDVHLVIIGHVTNESYFQRLKDHIKDKALEKRVTVIEGLDFFSPDLVNAYHAGDMFLLPSIHEPFGIVILEAWAAGIPVLASNVGGIPSFVEPGKDAILCAVNSKNDFVQNCRDILNNKMMSMELAERGHEKVRKSFSWEVISKKLTSIYEEAMHENTLRK